MAESIYRDVNFGSGGGINIFEIFGGGCRGFAQLFQIVCKFGRCCSSSYFPERVRAVPPRLVIVFSLI